ncbi:ACT domain-containing protein [Candidatus Woesearchaeota archaeon]|nr:ACT domain-containing protein [Candidatus Woesearchaeota archaeon]
MGLLEVIKVSQVIVHHERYAYLLCSRVPLGKHFMVSQDADEITVITTENNAKKVKHKKDIKWFKLFEIRVATPFVSVGFLAAISSAIAAKGLTILMVSTFSKDYVLIHEEETSVAFRALLELGFPVVWKGQNTLVKMSKIHKVGVFAAKNFKKGETVLHFEPKVLTKDQIKALPSDQKKYVSSYKHGKYILQQGPDKYVNHACDPNTKVQNNSDVAIRDIHRGEEITSDYRKDTIQLHHFTCRCRSRNCQRWI